MQETGVPSPIREDPTCRAATKPESHNYWDWEPQLPSPWAATLEARAPGACVPQQEKPRQGEACTPQLERSPRLLQLKKSLLSSEDSAQPKGNKQIWKKKKKFNEWKRLSNITDMEYRQLHEDSPWKDATK